MVVSGDSRALRTITLLIAVCLISFPAQAKYSGGTGEPDDPYQIATAEDLMLLGDSPGDYNKQFILTADIDLDPNLPGRKLFDKAVIAPNWEMPFTGVFNVNGYTISRLTIVGKSYLGLFGHLGEYSKHNAEVRDLWIVDVNTVGPGPFIGGLAGANMGLVSRCYATGALSCIGSCVGGLLGFNRGSANQCYSTVIICGYSEVGGLVGGIGEYVTNCFWNIETSGQVTRTGTGGTGKTTAEMQTATTFLDAGWDFVGETANGTDDIWWILEGQDYPRLCWETNNN
jgi:hypothetical protein